MKVYVAQFVPYAWLVRWHLYGAKVLLRPLIAQRRRESAAGTLVRDEKFDNLLQFMEDAATGVDARPDKLAGRTLILTLASSHTTSMAACQALFQLCEYPEYIPELREEVRRVLEEDKGWRKTSLTKLRKLDSFIKESQRVHPPSIRESPRHRCLFQTVPSYADFNEPSRFQTSFPQAANALRWNHHPQRRAHTHGHPAPPA